MSVKTSNALHQVRYNACCAESVSVIELSSCLNVFGAIFLGFAL